MPYMDPTGTIVISSTMNKIVSEKIIPARDPKQCENKSKMQCMCDHSM